MISENQKKEWYIEQRHSEDKRIVKIRGEDTEARVRVVDKKVICLSCGKIYTSGMVMEARGQLTKELMKHIQQECPDCSSGNRMVVPPGKEIKENDGRKRLKELLKFVLREGINNIETDRTRVKKLIESCREKGLVDDKIKKMITLHEL